MKILSDPKRYMKYIIIKQLSKIASSDWSVAAFLLYNESVLLTTVSKLCGKSKFLSLLFCDLFILCILLVTCQSCVLPGNDLYEVNSSHWTLFVYPTKRKKKIVNIKPKLFCSFNKLKAPHVVAQSGHKREPNTNKMKQYAVKLRTPHHYINKSESNVVRKLSHASDAFLVI